jgi:hypothetical protein
MVTPSHPAIAVRRRQEGRDLRRFKKGDEVALSALLRDGEHTLDQRGVFRVA